MTRNKRGVHNHNNGSRQKCFSNFGQLPAVKLHDMVLKTQTFQKVRATLEKTRKKASMDFTNVDEDVFKNAVQKIYTKRNYIKSSTTHFYKRKC